MKATITLLVILCGALGYNNYTVLLSKNQIELKNILFESENRLLKDQINETNAKINAMQTYDEGYKDALIRNGAPNTPGYYQEGWKDAIKATQPNEYSAGYHSALKQFEILVANHTAKSQLLIPDYSIETPIPAKFAEPKLPGSIK